MSTQRLILAILVMAVVTYLPRVLPLAVFRKKINRFLQSFLLYMPYGVLAAMVFPDVLASTASLISAIAGTVVALALSYKNLGLLPVALCSVAAVFVCEYGLGFLGII